MLVKDRMTPRPITVADDIGVDKALHLMHTEHVRRLPIVDKHGKMVGIVSELDLLKVSPSPATSLSIYEIPYLLSQIKMRDIMSKDVITVIDDTPLEEAARLMADNKIGGLPVMRDGDLVGIITETDLFKVFLELLGAREEAVRLTVEVPSEKGTLAKIAGAIAEMDGNIMAMGTIQGDDPSVYLLTIRVVDVPQEELVAAMDDLGMKVLDQRYCELPVSD